MKKVIFDLDGTLYQTQISILKALHSAWKEFGLSPVEEEQVLKHIGKTMEDFLEVLLPKEINKKDFKDRVSFYEKETVKKEGKLFPGTEEMLKELKNKGYKLYTCSNGSKEYIRLVLESTGIEHYFTDVLSAKYNKSKGEVLQEFITSNGFVVLVGDTAHDFLGAKEVNIPSIGVTYGYGSEEDFSKATFTASDTEEVINLVVLTELLHGLAKRLVHQKNSRIIGINGVDTSGKTVFTKHFSRFLNSVGIDNQILHMDDFHNPAYLRYQGKDEIEAYYNNAFNYQQAVKEVLEPFKTQGRLEETVRCLNLDSDLYENFIHYSLKEDSVLLVEGVLLFREPIRRFLDSKVFLYIGFDEVLNRAKIRDVPKYGEEFLKKYIMKYIPIQKKYIQEYHPVKNSDIVIDNQDYKRPYIINMKEG